MADPNKRSVTGILKGVAGDKGFDRDAVAGAIEARDHIPAEVLIAEWDAKSDAGTAMHVCIETVLTYYMTRGSCPLAVMLVHAETATAEEPSKRLAWYLQGVTRVHKWVATRRSVKVIALEYRFDRVFDWTDGLTRHLTGYADAVLQYKSGSVIRYLVVDWKTCRLDPDNKEHKRKHAKHKLQVAIYSYLWALDVGVPYEDVRASVFYTSPNVAAARSKVFSPSGFRTSERLLDYIRGTCDGTNTY